MSTLQRFQRLAPFVCAVFLGCATFYSASAATPASSPLFLSQGATPIVMLTMSNDHQLYFKAYDDYSDVDGDGELDTTYEHAADYYGYFDSEKCYVYQNSRFEPVTTSASKYCNETGTSGQWSGNFLNWATMTRIDTVRKILYGGRRYADPTLASDATVLERAMLPHDAHSFAKYYNGTDLSRLTPFSVTTGQANLQATGITICNTTDGASGLSQDVDTSSKPPLMKVAAGNFSLWASNERWQCRWSTGANGNDSALTGIYAASTSPSTSVGLTADGAGPGYIVRVQACVPGLIHKEKCKTYPSGNIKPSGLLQTYGDNGQIHFGLLTGSYNKNKSGGVLRKNVGAMSDEINVETDGTFKTAAGIIDTLNRFRVYGYSFGDGTYDSDNCSFGKSGFANGECRMWGNPQSEMYLEALRFLAGKQPSTAFSTADPLGLTSPAWVDPLTSENYCAVTNIIQFNASTSSFDGDELGNVSDLSITDLDYWTNKIGAGEEIHGKAFFIGETASDANQLCTAKLVDTLAGVKGTCPDAPRHEGTYQIAGLAHFARTSDLRSALPTTQTVKTYGVALAPAVPKVEIPVPGQSNKKVTLLPACQNRTGNEGNCAIVDFKIVSQTSSSGSNAGRLYVNWEAAEQGGDFDQDMWGVIDYSVSSTEITVKTRVLAQSSGRKLGFGYVLSGTTTDGFHVHSGINDFDFPGITGPTSWKCTSSNGNGACNVATETSRTYSIGSSTAALLQQPLYYAAKWGGFNDADESGSPNEIGEWDADGDGRPDTYFFATNPGELEKSLAKAFDTVAKEAGSSSAVATNSTRLDTDTVLYQARFNSTNWSGQLLAYNVNANGTVGTEKWDAAEKIPAEGSRRIFTHNGSAGVELIWSNLTADQQAYLQGSAETDLINAQKRLGWLRGSQADEQPAGILRERDNLLGDIVNSDPVYAGAQNFRYDLLPAGTPGQDSYAAYVETKKSRTPVVYVGANDGMLHAFDANTGIELFAYMPSGALANAQALTRPDYGSSTNPHRYFVDGPLFVGDAYIGSEWRTILVGTMGAGGKTVFALDVTSPTSFGAANVLFELNPSTTAPVKLGHVLGQPLIVRLPSGKWAAVFGNGYDSGAGTAHLFMVNLADAADTTVIDTDTSGSNGLSAPSILTSEQTATEIFAGDLQGNMWKFDVSNSGAWGVAYKASGDNAPLFTAKDSVGNRQPITSAPVLGRNPEQSFETMVYFGTGSYYASTDNVVGATPRVESVYGILDGGAIGAYTDRADIPLHQKTISAQTTSSRTVTEGQVDWASVKGWYLDLINPAAVSGSGERVISKPLLAYDRLLFVTFSPSLSACSFGGSGWLMDVGAVGDDSSNFQILSNDGSALDVAVLKLGALIKAGDQAYLPLSDTKGNIIIKSGVLPPEAGGRMSWRQLR